VEVEVKVRVVVGEDSLPEFCFVRPEFQTKSTISIAFANTLPMPARLIVFGWWEQRKIPKPERITIDFQSRPAIALDLHAKFYSALASGNIFTVRDLICSGLANHARNQISHRHERMSAIQTTLPTPASQDLEDVTLKKSPIHQNWKIIRYTSLLRAPFFFRYFPWPFTSLLPATQAKIVSDRIVPLPIGNDQCYVRQCIVRISSLQKLEKPVGAAAAAAALSSVTEYVVIQQMRANDHDRHWKLWGTIKPLTREQLMAWVNQSNLPPEERSSESRTSMWNRAKLALPLGGMFGS
jgi:hypothetical protein